MVNHKYLISLARQNIENNFQIRSKNQKPSKIELSVGDLVLLRVKHLSSALDKVTHKFFHLFEDPYLLSKAVGGNAYVLADPNNPEEIKGTYNRTNLRKYYH